MTTDVEKLLIRLEVTQRRFERQLANADKTAARRARGIEQKFQRANKNIQRSFNRLGQSATSSFRGIGRAATALLGGLGIREISRYADAWTMVENKIRAAEQISGVTARTTAELNDLAASSRSGLEETADLYARLLRVSGNIGASEAEVAQATETVAKAFKAGGAAASEQAAGILQLSQALGSGFLQGDELRSLRENAPIVAQAIANEFETTIGGLKELGAEGELTADRVFRAILNAQGEIEKSFAVTAPTIADGFTLLKNGMIELVGAFDAGSGASSTLAQALSEIGGDFSDKVDAAERFGRQVREAFLVMGEGVDAVEEALNGIGLSLDDASLDVTDFVAFVVNVLQRVISEAVGVGTAVAQGVLEAVNAVASGAVAIANGAIAAVEGILNKIIDGVQFLVNEINGLIDTANSISPVEISKLNVPLNLELGRVEAPNIDGNRTVLGAYQEGRDATRAALDGAEDAFLGLFERIERAGDTPLTYGPPRRRGRAPGGTNAPVSPTGTGNSGGGGGGGRGGGSQREQNELLRDAEKLFDATRTAAEKYAAEQERLSSLLDAGVIDQDTYNRAIKDLAEEFDSLDRVAKEAAGAIKGAFDGLFDDPKRALEDLAKQLAQMALFRGLSTSLPGIFGSGGIIPLGSNATGTDFWRGGLTRVNERGGEIMNLPQGTQIIPHDVSKVMAANAGRRGAPTQVNVINNGPGEARTERTRGPDGREMVNVIVEESIARGRFDGANRGRFGSRPQVGKRG